LRIQFRSYQYFCLTFDLTSCFCCFVCCYWFHEKRNLLTWNSFILFHKSHSIKRGEKFHWNYVTFLSLELFSCEFIENFEETFYHRNFVDLFVFFAATNWMDTRIFILKLTKLFQREAIKNSEKFHPKTSENLSKLSPFYFNY
jgi:hypothetical protein